MPRSIPFLIAVTALLLESACGGASPSAPAPPPPAGPRVLLVGIDAADEDMIIPLVRAGRLPAFAAFYREGASGSLRSHRPMLSPILWTSIATGVSPERHAILDFVEPDGAGRFAPIGGARRARETVWEILGRRGTRVAVAGWLATHPATEVNGWLVSDRFTVHPYESPDAAPPTNLSGTSWPPALASELEPLRVAPQSIPPADLERTFGLTWMGDAGSDGQALRVVAATTATWEVVAQRLIEKTDGAGRAEFVAVYFEGLDRLLHVFGGCMPPPVEGTDPDRAKRYAQVADRYLEHLDGVLARLTAACGAGTTTILVSDHGWKTGFERPARDPSRAGPFAAEWHDEDGILLVRGPGVKPGLRQDADLYDVAPTVLALFGAPGAAEFRGHALETLFERPLPDRPAPVASYPRAAAAVPAGGAEAQVALENLRKLGYVAGGAGAPADRSRVNLATVDLEEGRWKEAADIYREFLARHPDDYDALYNLGFALRQNGDGRGAAAAWQKAARARPSTAEPWVALGELASAAKDWPGALEAFRRGGEIEPRSATVWNHLGAAQCETGRFADGEASFRKAIDLNPRGVGSWINLSRVLERTGRKPEAIDLVRRALETLPAEDRLRRRLADLEGAPVAASPSAAPSGS